MKDKPTNL